jgi:predicted naringenin-chalcone synthase
MVVLTGDPRAGPAPVRLAGIGTATPPRRFSRAQVGTALARMWPRLQRRASLLSGPDQGFRHLLRDPDEMATPLPLGEQTAQYGEFALELARQAAEQALEAAGVPRDSIGLLVVASCTGFVLPGVDVRLVSCLWLRDDVWRMPFLQFGCAGGAAGLARAVDWTRTHPGERALLVAVEVPSRSGPATIPSTTCSARSSSVTAPVRWCSRRQATRSSPASTSAGCAACSSPAAALRSATTSPMTASG